MSLPAHRLLVPVFHVISCHCHLLCCSSPSFMSFHVIVISYVAHPHLSCHFMSLSSHRLLILIFNVISCHPSASTGTCMMFWISPHSQTTIHGAVWTAGNSHVPFGGLLFSNLFWYSQCISVKLSRSARTFGQGNGTSLKMEGKLRLGWDVTLLCQRCYFTHRPYL